MEIGIKRKRIGFRDILEIELIYGIYGGKELVMIFGILVFIIG